MKTLLGPRSKFWLINKRNFSISRPLHEIRNILELPSAIQPSYHETKSHNLLLLKWPGSPRNILITKKENTPLITESLIEYARHIQSNYPSISIILEPEVASELHDHLPFPIYAVQDSDLSHYASKVDLATALGGDGTILHASALFASSPTVPPVLSFSMGTLGFLGEWRFDEYKRAFRDVYMSGCPPVGHKINGPEEPVEQQQEKQQQQQQQQQNNDIYERQSVSQDLPAEWAELRGKSMGATRGARVLLRNRLEIHMFDATGNKMPIQNAHAMNDVVVHRGKNPHLTVLDVFIGGKFLTSTVADGMIVSTPSGSTAYSLSSGGSIVHPLVSSLLLTPICPRSLSFRPLVLPAHSPISLRLSSKNRSQEVEVSIDGVSQPIGLSQGMEIKVWGEGVRNSEGVWKGGVPSIVRGGKESDTSEDQWVGGLNGLLKFNYPFGEG